MPRISKYGPLNRGDVREDGKVFYAYRKGRELWLDREKFKVRVAVNRKYEDVNKIIYEKKSHPALYYYDKERNLYYVGRSGAKERWVSYDQYILVKRRTKRKREEYRQRNKLKGTEKYKRGQEHPTISGLYFACYNNFKPCWKTEEEFKKYQELRSEYTNRGNRISRIRKKKNMRKIKNPKKRGAVKDGLVFWDYTSYGIEIWVTPEELEGRLSRIAAKSKRYREKLKNGSHKA